MFLTVQALRLDQHGEATRRLVARLSESLRAAGVLEVPLLVSLDDDRDALVMVGFKDRLAADSEHVRLARAALAQVCASLGVLARPLELFTERIRAGGPYDSGYYRVAICETEGRALREFADRSATVSTAPTKLGLLWVGRADQGETALVLTGYANDSSFRAGRAIEDVPGGARRELGVRLYASERSGAIHSDDRNVMTRLAG